MPDRRTDVGDQPMLPARTDTATRRSRELVTVRARADIFRSRMDESRDRFREALERFNERANRLNPVTYVRTHPWRWVVGGFGIGVLVGWLTSNRND